MRIHRSAAKAPTHYDTLRNMHQQYRHNASQINNYPF